MANFACFLALKPSFNVRAYTMRHFKDNVGFRFVVVALLLSGGLAFLTTVALARSPQRVRTGAPETQPPNEISSAPWFFSARSLQVNAGNRKAVAQFYRDNYVPHDKVHNGWSGSTTGCNPGKNSDAYDSATLQNLKYYRAMAGVPTDISFDEKYNRHARAAALMMEAKNDLSHGPGPDWPCYTDDGKKGAGSSNLCLGCVGPTAIDAYVQDSGVSGVGHRKWALHPRQRVLGNGSSKRANALYVFGDWRPEEEVAHIKKVAWPPEGFVPYRFGLDSGHPWSYTVFGSDEDLKNAKVSMTMNGTAVAVQQEEGRPDLLVWYPTGLPRATHENDYNRPKQDVSIQVEISNAVVDGKRTTLRYSVVFIDPAAVLAEENSEQVDGDTDNDSENNPDNVPDSETDDSEENQVAIDSTLNGPLLQAIYQGKVGPALDLLSRGADPNARYQDRWTALMYAAYFGHTKIVEDLLRRGADASVTLEGWDARAMAKSQGHDAIATILAKATNQSVQVPRTRGLSPPAP